jgi:type II secretory pathway pseudopilin PulG
VAAKLRESCGFLDSGRSIASSCERPDGLVSHESGRFAEGVTLIEIVVAVAVLVTAALGALGYQYHASVHARIARAQIVATRTAQLLLEDWKSAGGSDEYDPAALELGFSPSLKIPSYWSEGEGTGAGTPLNNGVYAVTVDYFQMLLMLGSSEVSYDKKAEVKLKKLTVTVKHGTLSEGASELEPSVTWVEHIPPVTLATYVRLDASGG